MIYKQKSDETKPIDPSCVKTVSDLVGAIIYLDNDVPKMFDLEDVPSKSVGKIYDCVKRSKEKILKVIDSCSDKEIVRISYLNGYFDLDVVDLGTMQREKDHYDDIDRFAKEYRVVKNILEDSLRKYFDRNTVFLEKLISCSKESGKNFTLINRSEYIGGFGNLVIRSNVFFNPESIYPGKGSIIGINTSVVPARDENYEFTQEVDQWRIIPRGIRPNVLYQDFSFFRSLQKEGALDNEIERLVIKTQSLNA